MIELRKTINKCGFLNVFNQAKFVQEIYLLPYFVKLQFHMFLAVTLRNQQNS